MLPRALLAAALLASAAVAVPAQDGPPPAPPPSPVPPAPPPIPPTPPEAGPATGTMPEYTPCGIKDDFKELRERKNAVKNAMGTEALAAAKSALEALREEFIAKWSALEVPAPEAHYLAHILHEAGKSAEAVPHARRWLEVAPADNVNYLPTTTLLICCMAASGDFQGARDELKAASETTYKDKHQARAEVLGTLAMYMLKHGKLEMALETFETCMTTHQGDMESAILAVELAQRVGKPAEAVRIARKAVEFFKEGKTADRAKHLLQGAQLIGKAAPGFAGAKCWKGVGGPVPDADLKGRVTVVFSWNMKSAWNAFFFQRMHVLLKDTAERGVRFVGISRLARFDPTVMETREEMAEEEELGFYDDWTKQYGVTYPLAVYPRGDERMLRDWAAHVVPLWIVIGKDGKVAAVGVGKDDERVAVLRELVERELKR